MHDTLLTRGDPHNVLYRVHASMCGGDAMVHSVQMNMHAVDVVYGAQTNTHEVVVVVYTVWLSEFVVGVNQVRPHKGCQVTTVNVHS